MEKKLKMYYLTFGDAPSGIYTSQVIDVCKFLNDSFNLKVRLIAIISIRGFLTNKKQIISRYPESIVLPMIPRLVNWKLNFYILSMRLFLFKPAPMIARGALATSLALKLKKYNLVSRVCLDGRGSYSAEWKEYNVVEDIKLKNEIEGVEENAVNKSNFRLAVSQKLVQHWTDKFNYKLQDHVIIPCTLSKDFFISMPSREHISVKRKEYNYKDDDIILCYSGSAAGWQSSDLIDQFLLNILAQNDKIQILLLSNFELDKFKSFVKFPGRIKQMWLNHENVQDILNMSDYGMLIREKSVTNEVASPTKFAEYLSSGLPVIISENLGDYSEFVKKNNCGIVFCEKQDSFPELLSVSIERKQMMMNIAANYFAKNAHLESYHKLIKNLLAAN
jgi:glycosyltransferase involved in cell wall biosynthesis